MGFYAPYYSGYRFNRSSFNNSEWIVAVGVVIIVIIALFILLANNSF